jgi:hypothetical protein
VTGWELEMGDRMGARDGLQGWELEMGDRMGAREG